MSIEDRVARIEAFLGDIDIRHGADIARLKADPSSWPIMANGDYQLGQNIHQLREDINQKNALIKAMSERIEALESRPVVQDTALVSKVSSIDTRLKAVESRPSTSVQPSQPVPIVDVPQDGSGNGILRELWLKAGAIVHSFINSENDGGLGICFNFSIPFGWRKGSTHTDPRMPQIVQRFEQDGVWSVGITKPDLVPNPTIYEELSPGEWDYNPNTLPSRAGKDYGIRSLGLDGRKTRNLEIFSGIPGRVVDVCGVPDGGTPNAPTGFRFRLDPATGVYEIKPDGTERKL